MTKIVLLNARARAGKDFAADFLTKEQAGRLHKFAAPIKRAAAAIYCGGDMALFAKYDTPELKDVPQVIFFGKTCREVQIAISERFLKIYHGQELLRTFNIFKYVVNIMRREAGLAGAGIFGEILAQDILRQPEVPLWFISDSGFRPEAQVLVNHFGASSIFLARIHRAGQPRTAIGERFQGDSRSLIDLSDLGVRCADVENDGNGIAAYRDAFGRAGLFDFIHSA